MTCRGRPNLVVVTVKPGRKKKRKNKGKKHKEEATLAAAKEISVDAQVAETL